MSKSLRYIFLLVVFAMPYVLQAQVDTVTVKELNTYPETPESTSDIGNHPLAGEEVQFTAVVVSYPKSSGNASFTEDTENFPTEGGSISRIHIFVVDTTALTAGKEGMYMQIVESGGADPAADDFAYFLEELQVGDIINVVGDLGFFEGAAQFDVTQWDIDNGTNVIGNVEDAEFSKFAPLLDPITGLTVDDLNQDNGDGTSYINYENYEKYANAFVEITNAPVIARDAFDAQGEPIDRPNWVIAQNSASMYMYDISLRYRNGKDIYRNSYNYRREAEDGAFVPPSVGSTVKVQGFMNVDDFAGAIGRITQGEAAFKFTPFEDGVLWFNGERNVNGVDGFVWPDHIEVLGVAPTLSNFSQTPEAGFDTSTEVALSIDATGTEQPDESTSTVASAVVIYTTPSGTDTLAMSASGDTYTATLPTFSDLTPVSYYIEATDNNDLIARYPDFGSQSFFVSDGAIAEIEDIQKPAGGGEGPSNLVGGTYETDINATVVSEESEDGMIIVHDNAAEWGGIFLSPSTETSALVKGDLVNITEATVQETDDGLTYLTNVQLTVTSSGNDYDAVIPVITTADFVAALDGNVVESYEGMVVKLENVELIDYAGFGEFRIASADADTILVNDDFAQDGIGETDIPSDLDDHLRLGTTIPAFYGIIHTSFGAAKVQPRTLADIQADNYTTPVLDFSLLTPMDSSEVSVTSDVTITWEETEDYDGADVTYEWVLYSEADTTEIVSFESNEDATAAELTLPFADLDDLLANTANLEVGESESFFWNVRVSDGSDTLGVASDNYVNNDNEKVYVVEYFYLTLERGMQTSNEPVSGIPASFDLKQNYPNPFNPTTKIAFSLPEASDVKLNVFDMLGRKVATIVNDRMNAGNHQIQFDASRLASGMYIYRIDAGSFTSTKRMMLIK